MWQLQLHAHLKLNKDWDGTRSGTGTGTGAGQQPSRAKSHLNGNKCCVQTIYKNQFYNVMRSEPPQCHVFVGGVG